MNLPQRLWNAVIIWDKNSGGTLTGIVWQDNVFYATKGRPITWSGDYDRSIWDESGNVYWSSPRPTQPTTGSTGSSVEMDPTFAAVPDSLSFLPVLLGTQPEDQPVRQSLVVGRSVRCGSWKWIEGREPEFFGRRGSRTIPAKNEAPGQLYNLADDLGETRNLAAERPEIVAKLKQELERIQNTARTRD